MGNQSSEFLKTILDKVDDLFAEEIGPVAAILCSESRDFWLEKLKRQNNQPGLRNIYIYVNHLASSIEDEAARQMFIDNVYKIDSLSILKNR